LSQCAECKAVLREEIATFGMLAAIPEEQPRHDVWMLVRSQTKPRRVRPAVWLHGLVATNLRKVATATIAALLLAVGYYNVAFVTAEAPNNSKPKTVVTVYSDDPLGGHTDAVVASIDDM